MSRLRPGLWGSGGWWCITSGQDVLDRLSLLGKALNNVAEQPSLGDGSFEKAYFVNILNLFQVEPDMVLLDHQSGLRLPEGLQHDFRHPEGEVSQTQLLHQPRVRTTLVHLFQCLDLVDLQNSHGMQGRGSLACSTVSFGCESSHQLTGFGWETRTIPPSGGVLRAPVHRNHSLHLGNVHTPSCCPAIEDGGGDARARD